MEERPTSPVYIEILTCTTVIQYLEESRSHGNEREAKRTWGQGARPSLRAIQAPPGGSCSTDLRD